MKLISMTDFVLEQKDANLRDNFHEETDEYFNKCVNYANFLKKPLNLGMFVPCVYNEVLEEPLNYNKWILKELNTPYDLYLSKYEQYKQAKERVLFEGFYYKCNIDKYGKKWEYIRNKHPHVFTFKQIELNTIESLLTNFKKEFSITLTKSAQKQLGL